MASRSSASDDSLGQGELPLFDEPGEPPPPTSPDAPPADDEASRRTFLGWDRPVLDAAADHLARDWDGRSALDLSDRLVVVATRHAGRRLREHLARRAAAAEAAVVPPLVVTQDYLVSPDRLERPERPAADRHLSLLIGSALLLDVDLDRHRRLFPVDPVERDLRWAMKTARELLAVRNLLVESGLTFAEAATRLGEQDMEPGRWRDLAKLESAAIHRTHRLGFEDEAAARLAAAGNGTLPETIRRIAVIATPDLRGVTIDALRHHAASHDLEIAVHAPEDRADRFDDWGRPLGAAWRGAEIDIPDSESTIHQAATPADEAALACRLMEGAADPAAHFAVGVPDPEVIAPVEQAAAERGWSTYDPSGRPVTRHGVHYLLEQTARLLSGGAFDAAARLMRCPDFGRALAEELSGEADEEKVSLTRLLEHLDEFALHCLPETLGEARAAAGRWRQRWPLVEPALRWMEDWMNRFRREDFSAVLTGYLSRVFADRRFRPGEESHGAFSEVADVLLDVETAFAGAAPAFGERVDAAERFQILLELLRDRHLYDERGARDIDLQGWLELLWEDAPHLVVTGMNDEFVPESILGHAYLPDSARRALGMPDNDVRFARDAYLLTSLIESRRHSAGRPGAGRVDLVFGRRSESGDPLRPSRLLFQCADDELPGRTLQFFGEDAFTPPPLPWALPWKLKPQPLPDDARIFERLSVTQFRSYLTCPFRFYLQHGLRMEEIDPEKSEMDSRDFGTLLHEALERFARDPEAAASTDPDVIRAALEREIDALLGQRYGSQLSTPVLIQREAARRRLAWWAEIEAAERAAGWRILETETPLSSEDHPFALAGHSITGRIDRIEEHEDGRLRVFDFKTHAVYDPGKYRNKRVGEYHVAPIKRTEDPESFPEWARVENEDGKPSRWVDLQLPLYRLALAERFPGRAIEAGHIALGPTEAEVVLDVWEGLDDPLLESARACAEGVIEAVRASRFWPPAERLPWSDPFEELLFGEAKMAVDPTGLGG